MASTTMVHIRVDEKLKREACAALDGMGLSLSDAVRLLLVRVAAERLCLSKSGFPTQAQSELWKT